jgi:CHRD domain/Secretion system C-terminal sorting domain
LIYSINSANLSPLKTVVGFITSFQFYFSHSILFFKSRLNSNNMLKLYKKFITLNLLLCFFSISLLAKDARYFVTAQLNGAQENPAVTTKGRGLMVMTVEENGTMVVNAIFDSLSGPITNCHFHKALRGVNGGTVFSLFPSIKGNRLYVVIPADQAKLLLPAILKDSIYINVHTAANGGGEIRGQLRVERATHYTARMFGANEIPAVTTAGFGAASFFLSQNNTKLEYKIVVNNLSGAITNAHLHFGASNRSGSPAYPLAFTATSNVLSGVIDVNAPFVDSLNAGNIYANIHTGANGGGEIRGQVDKNVIGIGFDALLDGGQEVPAVTTTARGIVVGSIHHNLDSVTFGLLGTGLTATNAHIHGAVTGVAGGVILNPGAMNALIPNFYSATLPITADNITKILRGDSYGNIHSATNTGGEVRGQISTVLLDGVVADICGAQEVPAVPTSNGQGTAIMTFDRLKTLATIQAAKTGLTVSNAHVHVGAKGVSGGALIPLATDFVGNSIINTTVALARTTIADSALNGLHYFNIHTSAFAGGEIRGQFGTTLTGDCPLSTKIVELNGQLLKSSLVPNPTLSVAELVVNSPQNFDGNVTISDITGKQVSNSKVNIQEGDNRIPLNSTNLSNGIYFIQLWSRESGLIVTEKLVKQQ